VIEQTKLVIDHNDEHVNDSSFAVKFGNMLLCCAFVIVTFAARIAGPSAANLCSIFCCIIQYHTREEFMSLTYEITSESQVFRLPLVAVWILYDTVQ
jgi:hypothetical protein